MKVIDCEGRLFQDICEEIRNSQDKDIKLINCVGHRYIGVGIKNKNITIEGIPGNALGAYNDGAIIEVKGSAQDAIGDTMNDGKIIIHGSSGDATGYAMRGGEIYVEGNAGYRAGIHMKAYKDKFPVIVIGGKAGSFLGEYQAGGIIIVLGIDTDSKTNVGYFTGNGMHGGKIILRSEELPELPSQIVAHIATEEDKEEISNYVRKYCTYFGKDLEAIMSKQFFVLQANTKNPYKQLYVNN